MDIGTVAPERTDTFAMGLSCLPCAMLAIAEVVEGRTRPVICIRQVIRITWFRGRCVWPSPSVTQ